MPYNPLQGLLSAANRTKPELPGYDPAALYALQDERQGELEDRGAADVGARGAAQAISNPEARRSQTAGYQGDLDRISALLKPLNEDIQESPITQQRAQVQQTEDANQKAMLAGFLGGKPNAVGEPMSPSAEAGQSATEMERQKITAPIEAARVKGQADIAAEQERSKGLIGAAHEREVGYSGRTSYQMQKDIADNANKMQVALVNANRAVDAAAIGRIITENAKVQEGIDRGALQADDPAVMGHLATLEAQLRQFQSPSAGPNTTVPTTTEGHAQRLLQQMPGKSIDEYLNHVEANEGGFDRPQDKEGLRQALIRAGAH